MPHKPAKNKQPANRQTPTSKQPKISQQKIESNQQKIKSSQQTNNKQSNNTASSAPWPRAAAAASPGAGLPAQPPPPLWAAEAAAPWPGPRRRNPFYHRWPFGKTDGPGKWKKPHVSQGPLFFKQTKKDTYAFYLNVRGVMRRSAKCVDSACFWLPRLSTALHFSSSRQAPVTQ